MDDARRLTESSREKVEQVVREGAAGGDDEVASLGALLAKRRNVILYGPPGTGKTRAANRVAAAFERTNGRGSVFPVTFHPSYSYEDFVEGYRPIGTVPGVYGLREGLLLLAAREASERAKNVPPSDVLLLIDEINRGDVARILGEVVTYIEPAWRGQPFRLSQSPEFERRLPPNLLFLGTMNTADKSVSLLDVALRRRFAFVEFKPDSGAYARATEWLETAGGIPIGAVLDGLNERLRREGIEPERAVGHALLAVASSSSAPLSDLLDRFAYDVIPLVDEYCYGDRTRSRRILGDLLDGSGRAQQLSDEEFERALGTIAADAPGWTSGAAAAPEPVAEAVTSEGDGGTRANAEERSSV